MLERLEVGSIVIIVVIEINFAGASQVIPHFKMLVLGVECLFLSVIVSTRTHTHTGADLATCLRFHNLCTMVLSSMSIGVLGGPSQSVSSY